MTQIISMAHEINSTPEFEAEDLEDLEIKSANNLDVVSNDSLY